MPQKPIIMSAWSVLALLDKRKTQTRRPVKLDILNKFDICKKDGPLSYEDEYGDHRHILEQAPYQVGDELWVKEALFGARPIPEVRPVMWYQADQMPVQVGDRVPQWRWKGDKLKNWYMPRAAARIFRTVTGVRCEYVQDITVEDVGAEGIDVVAKLPGIINAALTTDSKRGLVRTVAKQLFESLWNSIYKEPPYRWEDNPLNFVYDMEVTCDKPR